MVTIELETFRAMSLRRGRYFFELSSDFNHFNLLNVLEHSIAILNFIGNRFKIIDLQN